MALFPLHFFFTALYYTDTGSSLLVIGAHLLALRRAYLAAGLIAAAATAFRQTNAVWAAFTLAVSGLCVRLKSTPWTRCCDTSSRGEARLCAEQLLHSTQLAG